MIKPYKASSIICWPFSCRRDELSIRGYIFRKETGTLPAVILSHGFMANQRMVRHYAEFLAGLG